MSIMAGKCASLVEIANSSSGYRNLAGGTQWVKAPTAAPRSVLTTAYAWNSTAPLFTSDAGLLACRELDDALGLTETATACLQESRSATGSVHPSLQPGELAAQAMPAQGGQALVVKDGGFFGHPQSDMGNVGEYVPVSHPGYEYRHSILIRGSRTSRMASPMKFTASTVNEIATPGGAQSQGWFFST